MPCGIKNNLWTRIGTCAGIRAGVLCFLLFLLVGCREDMHRQPVIAPGTGSAVFADGRAERQQIAHTVARGQLDAGDYAHTASVTGPTGYRVEQEWMPFPVTMDVIRRGQERFNVYCAPCHSRVGNGLGMAVQRGFRPAANLQDQVRLAQRISHYVYVMGHGYETMPDYATQLTVEDRWAVAAYIRALQLSQSAGPEDVAVGTKIEELRAVATAQGHAEWADAWPKQGSAVQSSR